MVLGPQNRPGDDGDEMERIYTKWGIGILQDTNQKQLHQLTSDEA